MSGASTWSLRLATLAIAIAAIVVACRNDVPGPTLPLPAPEVAPLGPRPKPQPIHPVPIRVDTDAGIPLPAPSEPSAVRRGRPLRVAHIPPDAGDEVTDAFDLPPLPDSDVEFVPDAAQPLQ